MRLVMRFAAASRTHSYEADEKRHQDTHVAKYTINPDRGDGFAYHHTRHTNDDHVKCTRKHVG